MSRNYNPAINISVLAARYTLSVWLLLVATSCQKKPLSPEGAVDIVIHLVDENNVSTAHLLGMASVPQKPPRRNYVASLGVTKIREFDTETIEGAWAYRVKTLGMNHVTKM